MGWLFNPVADAKEITSRDHRRNLADLAARNIDPGTVDRIGQMGRWFPWMPAGVSMGLARAGFNPLSPEVQQIASDVATSVARNTALGYRQPGDRVNSRNVPREARENVVNKLRERARQVRVEEAQHELDRIRERGGVLADSLDGITAEQYAVMRAQAKGGGSHLAQIGRAGASLHSQFSPAGQVQAGVDRATNNPVASRLEPVIDVVTDNPLANAARGTMRVGTAAMQAPQQLAQAQYRTTMENVREHGFLEGVRRSGLWNPDQLNAIYTQTDVGQIQGALQFGEKVDTGSGWFVGQNSGVGRGRRRAEVARGGTYGNGQVRTIGRDFADVFFEPGTREFTIASGLGDAAVALGADAVSLDAAMAARNANRMFRTAEGFTTATTNTGRFLETTRGLISHGTRPVIDEKAIDAYLSSDTGRRTIDALAETTSFSTIDKALGRKVDPALVKAITDETDPAKLADLLRGELGVGVRTRPGRGVVTSIGGRVDPLQVAGFRVKDRLSPRAARSLYAMPGMEFIDLDDPRAVVDYVDRQLVNSLADRATIDQYMTQVAEATTRRQRGAAVFDMTRDIRDRAVAEFTDWSDPEAAQRATRIFEDELDKIRVYARDSAGNPVNPLGTTVTVNGTTQPTPLLPSDHLGQFMPALDPRELRRVFTSERMKTVLNSNTMLKPEHAAKFGADAGDLRRGFTFLDAAQARVWKPAQLIRAAYTLRVVGEEQARIAAMGMSSLFKNPLGFASYLIADTPSVQRMLAKWGGPGEIGQVSGGLLRESDQYAAAMSRGGRVVDNTFRLSEQANYTRGMKGYDEASVHRLAHLADDPVTNTLARFLNDPNVPNPVQAMQDYAWRQQYLNDAITDIAALHPNAPYDVTTRAGRDQYIQDAFEQIRVATGDNPALIKAIADGKLDNVPMRSAGTPWVNQDAVKAFAPYQQFGPDVAVAPRTVRARGGKSVGDHYRFGINALMSGLASAPTNKASRSLVFNQKYVEEAIALAPRLDPSEAARLDAWAEATVGVSKADRDRIRAVVGTATGQPMLTLDDIDEIAKGYALDDVKSLLYDLADRGQFMDTFRLIFPFGEAWKEMVTTWSMIGRRNPGVALTVKRVLEGGRNPELGEAFGQDRAFFFENDFGEEVVAYPGSADMMGALGLPKASMEARLAGFSLMTEVMPGVGPIVQLAAAEFMPDTPAWDSISSLIFPFGRPGDPKHPVTWLQEVLPAWTRPFWTGLTKGGVTGEEQRQFQNLGMDVIRYKIATGEFDITDNPDSRAEQKRLLASAKADTVHMLLVQSIAKNAAPSSPMFAWYLDAPDGRKLSMLSLVEDYRNMIDEHGYSDATVKFLERYGDNAFLLMQNKSMSISPGILAATDVANDWLRENMWAQSEYPVTYGFFAPSGGKYNAQAYHRQLELQERKPLTMEQFVQAGNDMIGKSIYYAEREAMLEQAAAAGRVSLDAEQQAYMRDLDEWLRSHYEGYDDQAGTYNRASVDEMIDELSAAVNDERLANEPISASIREYLEVREWVRAESKANLDSVNSYRSAVAGREYREYLEQYAAYLTEQNKGFETVWDRVFRSELNEGIQKDTQGEEE